MQNKGKGDSELNFIPKIITSYERLHNFCERERKMRVTCINLFSILTACFSVIGTAFYKFAFNSGKE